jgi:hypothetical protein
LSAGRSVPHSGSSNPHGGFSNPHSGSSNPPATQSSIPVEIKAGQGVELSLDNFQVKLLCFNFRLIYPKFYSLVSSTSYDIVNAEKNCAMQRRHWFSSLFRAVESRTPSDGRRFRQMITGSTPAMQPTISERYLPIFQIHGKCFPICSFSYKLNNK